MNANNLPYDPLADSLNIDSEIAIFPTSVKRKEQEEQFQEYVDADYSFARENIMGVILKAADALDEVIKVAKASQAPRAYEVVATMTKVILDGNKDLLDLAKKNKELKEIESTEEPRTINNNLIVTTDQLQKMLKDQGVVTTTRQLTIEPEAKKDGQE